jgi:hypothetical protein
MKVEENLKVQDKARIIVEVMGSYIHNGDKNPVQDI